MPPKLRPRVSFKLSPTARLNIKNLHERYSRLNISLKKAQQTKASFRNMPGISGEERAEYVVRANEEISRLRHRIAGVNGSVNKIHVAYNKRKYSKSKNKGKKVRKLLKIPLKTV